MAWMNWGWEPTGWTGAIILMAAIGLLWASPFGPIRFDLAYPITKRAWDKTQFFRFSGGTTF